MSFLRFFLSSIYNGRIREITVKELSDADGFFLVSVIYIGNIFLFVENTADNIINTCIFFSKRELQIIRFAVMPGKYGGEAIFKSVCNGAYYIRAVFFEKYVSDSSE